MGPDLYLDLISRLHPNWDCGLYLQMGSIHSSCNLSLTHVHQNMPLGALPGYSVWGMAFPSTTYSFMEESHTPPRLLPWSHLWEWHPSHWVEPVDFIPLVSSTTFLSCHWRFLNSSFLVLYWHKLWIANAHCQQTITFLSLAIYGIAAY